VKEYERAVIFRLGRNLSGGAKGPGLFFILPCIDSMSNIDLRTVTFDIAPQEILTKDSVTVAVDGVVYFRIFDPVASINKVSDARYSTKLLAATSLRNILGTKSLQEILTDKEHIAALMKVSIFLISFLFL
jgi:erythrocyte band 7 integral membrane protein